MSETHPEEFERLVAAHIELGSTPQEAIALARAQLAKTLPMTPAPLDKSASIRRERKVRRSVRLLALGVLPSVLLWNAFVYRFDYGWGWLFFLSAGLPALLGLRQGVLRGIGTAKAWLKESVKVIPHTVAIYLLWSLTQQFEPKIIISLFLALLHAHLALIVGASAALIGGAVKGTLSKPEKIIQR